MSLLEKLTKAKSKTKQSATSKSSTEQHPDVFVSEFRGVRSLHLASEVNSDTSVAPIQGSMRLAVPDQIELEYVQQMCVWMLFNMLPKHIVQLGLGAASLTKFCYRSFPDAKVTAVELNPKVIAMCREQFRLPEDDERFQVLEMDAFDYVRQTKLHGKLDVIQVDLYDAEAEGPVLDSPEFYQACADCLNETGMLTVNLFANHKQREKNIAAMQACFDVVVRLPEVHDANVVAIAFKTAPEVDFDVLYQRAAILRVNYKLQAPIWVNGLKEWMLRD